MFNRPPRAILFLSLIHILIFHIIFRYARDGECALPAFAVFQRERVPGRKARFVAELFREMCIRDRVVAAVLIMVLDAVFGFGLNQLLKGV